MLDTDPPDVRRVTPWHYDSLPQLRAIDLPLRDAVAAHGPAWHFDLAGGPVTLSLVDAPPARRPDAVARVTAGERQITVGLHGDATTALSRLGAAGVDPADLDDVGLALVLEHVLSAGLDRMERRLGGPVAVTSVSRAGTLPDTMRLSLRMRAPHLGLDAAVLTLCADADTLPDCEALFADGQTRDGDSLPDLSGLPVSLSRISPGFHVERAALRSAARGQVIALDDGWSGPDHSYLRLPGGGTATLSLTEQGFVLGPYLTHDPEGDDTMDLTEDRPRELDDLDVTLTLELDRTTIKLSELSALGEGAVLPFSSRTPERVKVMANGQFFARGELLRVDDRIGVRLTELA